MLIRGDDDDDNNGGVAAAAAAVDVVVDSRSPFSSESSDALAEIDFDGGVNRPINGLFSPSHDRADLVSELSLSMLFQLILSMVEALLHRL